jgi:ribonuclease Z
MGRLIQKRIDGVSLCGFSIAGEETVLALPEHNVCFDIGRAPREVIPIDNVCLSHGHMDHAAGVAYYFSQRGFVGAPPGRVIVHRSLAQSIQRLMDVWAEIERHYSAGQVLGVSHLEDVRLRRDLLVRPFDVNHAAGALGYSLIEVRRKLREEFLGKTGPELVALKRGGVEIQDRREVVIATYTGDTALGRFLDLEFVRGSRLLLVECTFFERDHLVRARAGRHIHVDDLPQVLEAVAEARVVLLHVTRRTDLRTARRALERVVHRDDLERITFFMERPPRRVHAEGDASAAEAPDLPEVRRAATNDAG